MKFLFKHKDEERVLEWETMPVPDAITCEKVTGMTHVEWRNAMIDDRAEALAFGWWIAGHRAGIDVGPFVDLLEDRSFDLWALSVIAVPDEDQAAPVDKGKSDEGPTGPEQEATPGD